VKDFESRLIATLKKAMRYLKRILVLVGVVAVIYTVVGSYLYGEWYFGLIWRAKALKLSYWIGGAQYQLQTTPYYVIAVMIAAFLLSMFLYRVRQKFLPFVDRQWIWLCAGLAVIIFITAILVYKNDRASYELLESYGTLMATLQNIRQSETVSTSRIKPPIDFDYIDAPDIEAMYSQLGPDLVEQKVTVESTDTAGGKAAVEAGPLKLGGQIAQEQKEKSEKERLAFSPERKCVDLMLYTLERKITHQYVDDTDWVLQQIVVESQQEVLAIQRMARPGEPITRQSLEALRIEDPIWPSPEAIENEQQQQMIKRMPQMENELKSLRGSVLVEGEFSIENGPDNTLTFMHNSSKSPHPIIFRVVAPNTLKLSQLIRDRKARLNVFGTVTSPLLNDGDRHISVRALAIF